MSSYTNYDIIYCGFRRHNACYFCGNSAYTYRMGMVSVRQIAAKWKLDSSVTRYRNN